MLACDFTWSTTMTSYWFRRTRYWYRPCHLIAWLILILAGIFCATVIVAINRHTHSVSDLLYGVFPYVTCTALIVDRIAERTSHA